MADDKRYHKVLKADPAFFQVTTNAEGERVVSFPDVGDVIELTPESVDLLVPGGWIEESESPVPSEPVKPRPRPKKVKVVSE